MKKNSLSSALAAGAARGRTAPAAAAAAAKQKTVLIGAQFAPGVARSIKALQSLEANAGRTLKQLLGEAINDLCAKYGKPEPYQDDEA